MNKDLLIQYYRWLRQYGINDSHSGNASIRIGDTVWVTPSGACADTLIADALVKCSIDSSIGDNASLDAHLHIQTYQANSEAGAILHSHGPHAVALTLNGEDYIPPDLEGRAYFPRVPVATIAYGDYVEESPAIVARALRTHRIMIVRGHGLYAWGKDLNEAYKWTCSLELSAQTAYLAMQAGTLAD